MSLLKRDTTSDTNQAQQKVKEDISVGTFVASLYVAIAIFGVEFLAFYLLRGRKSFARIFLPKTILVPERERITAPPAGLFKWILPIFQTPSDEFIQKCGLDAYLFLRFLRMLLKIFIPLSVIILPVLLPLNALGEGNSRGMAKLTWGNIGANHQNWRWAHLILAVLVVIWCCYLFFHELRGFIRLRQGYLTSPQHRLRASATTVLVTSIPRAWLSQEALEGLYDVFPGGLRNIWINRNFDELSEKVKKREKIARALEAAETELIRKAKIAQLKQHKKDLKAEGIKDAKQEVLTEQDKADHYTQSMMDGPGLSANNPHQVAHTVEQALGEESMSSSRSSSPGPDQKSKNIALRGLETVGQGLGQGIGAVGHGIGVVGHGLDKIGKTVVGEMVGTLKKQRKDGDSKVNSPNTPTSGMGLVVSPSSPKSDGRPSNVSHGPRSPTGTLVDEPMDRATSPVETVTPLREIQSEGAQTMDGASLHPVETAPSRRRRKKYADLPYREEYSNDQDDNPEWRKYLKPKERDTMRLPLFDVSWWPSLPLIGKKVDVIYYCRKELARLNREIEMDQSEPENFPLMNSAFIQFNNQVAAHMACQSVSHHVPKYMGPRILEISPKDVLWDNLSVKWWERYIRTLIVWAAVFGVILGFAPLVAFTGALSNISQVSTEYHWLAWLDRIPKEGQSIIQGILPPALLAAITALVPIVLRFLARLQGLQTGMAVELAVQNYYFIFLLIQVFFITTISNSILTFLGDAAKDITSIPEKISNALPGASNYFFSYMILQGMTVSAGALMQVGSIIKFYVLSPLFDTTAREKWARSISLPQVEWGTFFPVYTNLAVIGLVYSVISPLVMVFNIITFSLFWIVYRYQTLYVNRFDIDTGGLLFPRAINQLFTGLYIFLVCLIGLFFTSENEAGNVVGEPQAIVLIVVLLCLIAYQFLLNNAFGPLFEYIPITLEDDAVARDEEFARLQAERWETEDAERPTRNIQNNVKDREKAEKEQNKILEAIEMKEIEERRAGRTASIDMEAPPAHDESVHPRNHSNQRGKSWADRDRSSHMSPGPSRHQTDIDAAVEHRRRRRSARVFTHAATGGADAEAQATIGDILFSNVHDEIEDLTASERDKLVQRAFQHEALRARRPCIWIPYDDIGVADDEVKRTKQFTDYIWISNEHSRVKGPKAHPKFASNPPDFSEVDLIHL